MSPEDQLRRRLQELTIRSIHLIEEAENSVKAELQPGLSTYKLDHEQAQDLYKCIEETLDCLRKLLVSI